MYLTDYPGRILKANIDGKNLRTFVNTGTDKRPEGLAIDYKGENEVPKYNLYLKICINILILLVHSQVTTTSHLTPMC